MNKKGFSLVELMVVVAIIGILAAVAVPSIAKYTAKSRQAEAKSQLSGLYTAMKAFNSEYGIYDNQFGVIGFGPEGDMRYNVGWANGCGGNLVAAGYTVAVTAGMASINSAAWCGVNAGAGAAAVNERCQLRTIGGGAAQPLVLTVCNPALGIFQARATGIIRDGAAATSDIWSIDNNKVLQQQFDGLN